MASSGSESAGTNLSGKCPFNTDGEGTESTAYAEYASMDSLISLQHPQTDSETEPGFIIMSQVMELLFKLLHVEFETARNKLIDDDIRDATWTIRRALKVQQTALSSWDFFSSMSPTEFADFRDILGSASGFQSASYRRLEFLLGNKRAGMASPHRGTPNHSAVLAQLEEPSLYDAVLELLARQGFDVSDKYAVTNPSKLYRPNASVEAAWYEIYRNQAEHEDLYRLGEALVDVAESFARWRYTHLVVVQRVLGGKPGTGGTDGVPWLGRIAEHRFFPELWTVRSSL